MLSDFLLPFSEWPLPFAGAAALLLWSLNARWRSRRSTARNAVDLAAHTTRVSQWVDGLTYLAVLLAFTRFGHVSWGRTSGWVGAIGLGLIVSGLGLRWAAQRTLGRFFVRKVVIQEQHRLVQNGVYQYIRHPGYAGVLLRTLGLVLLLSNWFALIVVFPLRVIAVLYRIRVEERVLRDTFAQAYLDYSRRTKRLVPGVF